MKKTLKERIAESVRGAAPDMNPKAKEQKKYESEVLPDIQEVIADPRLRLQILRLVGEDAALAAELSKFKAARKPLTSKLKELLNAKPTKFMVDGVRVVGCITSHTSVDKGLLLQHGVSPAVIAACTTHKKTYTLKVTPPKVEGVEEDDDED